MDRRVLVLALIVVIWVLAAAPALLVLWGGGLEGVLPGQPKVIKLRPGERAVVGGAEVMVDFGVARYFVCRDRETGWERILEARAGWVLAVAVVYYDQPPGYPDRVAWVEQFTANLTTARGETVKYCNENTCGDKIWRVFWPRGEAVECRYWKNPYPTFRDLTFPIEPGEEPATVRFHLYVDKTRYTVEVKLKD